MTYSASLVDSIKREETFVSPARHLAGDRADVITGGYGDTAVLLGQVVTLAQADARLRRRLDALAASVSSLVHVPLSQGQFDALVDFEYNCGVGALAGHTLLRLLNAGNYAGALCEFARWNRAGGQVLAGLVHRRALEAAWFAAPAPLAQQV